MRTKALILWLDATVAAVALAVVIGGITRLTESGLSITEWKPISGVLPPMTAAAWGDAYARFLQIPQAQTVHAGITLEAFKGIFWWEWVHRIAARLVGLVIAAPFFWFWAKGQIPPTLRTRLASLPVLVLAQGALGWYMVSSGLSERVNVSQYRLAAHLGLALVILVVALWTSASLRAAVARAAGTEAPNEAARSTAFKRARWALITDLFAIWTFLVILSGAFVAGLRAGKIYNTFPLMGGQIVPPGYGYLDGFFTNAFENPAAAQFHHRVLAIFTVFVAIGLWLWVSASTSAPARVVRAQRNVAIVACVQVTLGIATLLMAVPIAVAAAHQLTAVALLGATVLSAHAARYASDL
ncbi:MAG: COX15/CtaA family protein [Gemmatimonadetes bacterium]|nr:COX15/CtaA family protein [Gemmatimonadota bacterium]